MTRHTRFSLLAGGCWLVAVGRETRFAVISYVSKALAKVFVDHGGFKLPDMVFLDF